MLRKKKRRNAMTKKTTYLIAACLIVVALPILGACAPQPAAPGAKEPYKIGATFPQSGPLASWGVQLIPALELGVADVNRKGGVDGHPLQLVIEDTKSTPEGGVAAMRKVVQIDKVPMVLTIFTNVVTAQLPVAAELKVPLASTVQAPGLASKSEWLFVHATLLDNSLPPLIKVWEQKKVKKLFAFFPDNALGQFGSEFTKPAWSKSGGQYDEARFKLGETDFRGIVARAKAFDPDAVLFFGQGTLDEVSIVKQMREMGMNTPIYFVNGSPTVSTSRAALESLGVAEGIVFTTDKYDKQAAKVFIDAYQAKLGSEPDFAALQWYDIVQMTAEAIRKQGYTSEGIRKGMVAIKDFPLVGGGKASMDETRQSKVDEVAIFVIKGGQNVEFK